MHFRVIFHLDGSGVCFDPREPIHLDALLAWVLAPRQVGSRSLGRDDEPDHIELPLLRHHTGPHWVWRASALFPDGPGGEGLQFWRKRFRQSRADISTGSPNLTNGVYRDWNTPVPLILTKRLVAYASGNRGECKRLLREIRHLGKKRAHGHGKVVGIDLVRMEEDFSIVGDGLAMRWLPSPSGTRLVRLRPPYWNRIGRVRCCEVGEMVT